MPRDVAATGEWRETRLRGGFEPRKSFPDKNNSHLPIIRRLAPLSTLFVNTLLRFRPEPAKKGR
jgi:hypothetical protein